MQTYPKEQLIKLFQDLPPELKDAMGSLEILDFIEQSCVRNGIYDEKQQNSVTDIVGNVLFGILLPEDMERELKNQIGLEDATAKTIAREINRFIFYPLKPALELLHKGISSPEKQQLSQVKENAPLGVAKKEESEIESLKKPVKTKSSASDKYLEPIE